MAKIPVSFWGSPPIAAVLLELLLQSPDFEVRFVVTQADKARSRRGREILPSAVKAVADHHGLPVFTPDSLKGEKDELLASWQNWPVDLHIVLAYGKIIPRALFEAPALGSVNFHASQLPLLRGAAPIEYALWQGFHQTGWTLQKLGSRMDAGDILSQSEVVIDYSDDAKSLYQKMQHDLQQMALPALLDYCTGKSRPQPQLEELATYCGKIDSAAGQINWQLPSGQIINQARALAARSGVYSWFYDGKTYKKIRLEFDLGASSLAPAAGCMPGMVCEISPTKIEIACHDGFCLPVLRLQPEGKNLMPAADFVNGYRLQKGQLFSFMPKD